MSPASRGSGLKLIISRKCGACTWSPASRGSGLKYNGKNSIYGHKSVSRLAREWIEITTLIIGRFLSLRLPPRAGVD